MSSTNVGVPVPAVRTSGAKRRGWLLEQYFYFLMALLIPVIVVFGFSYTITQNLIHPVIPRPAVLYVHAAVFSGWLLFFLVQSALVRTHRVKWHRSIGWFGAAFGALIPIVGTATAIAMAHFNINELHQKQVESSLMIPLWDMVAFTGAFALAVYWRQKPEYHRRLVLIATCTLTAAAFGRFPPSVLNGNFFYVGVDLLIILGVLRDWIVAKKIHPTYLCALPLLVIGQTVVIYTVSHELRYWLKIAHAMLG